MLYTTHPKDDRFVRAQRFVVGSVTAHLLNKIQCCKHVSFPLHCTIFWYKALRLSSAKTKKILEIITSKLVWQHVLS